MDEKLLEALNNLIQQKTLSLEAFELVQDLKKKYEDLSKRFDYTQKDLERFRRENEALSMHNSTLAKKLAEAESRESSIIEREKKVTRLEIEKECADKMVKHTTETFKTVFENATLKNTIMRGIPVVMPGFSGGNGMYPTPPSTQILTATDHTSQQVGG